MKKFLLIASMFLLSITSKAQVTLEHIYPVLSDFELALLGANGYKYFIVDGPNKIVKAYNTNHTLWKTIDLSIIGAAWTTMDGIKFPTDHLFNSNDKVEFLATFIGGATTKMMLVDEDANILYDFGWKDVGVIHKVENDSFKLSLLSYNAIDTFFVYSLPGHLECDPCGTVNGMVRNDNNSSDFFSYPNPSNNYTKISYSLPTGINSGEIIIYNLDGKEIKSFKIDRAFDELLLSTQDLSSGTYLYSLKTSEGILDTKKMVVIK